MDRIGATAKGTIPFAIILILIKTNMD
jgi:hypothetical protein